MAISASFHAEALFEYGEAANYYLHEASLSVADGFVEAIEAAIAALVAGPSRWRIVGDSEIRRYVLNFLL